MQRAHGVLQWTSLVNSSASFLDILIGGNYVRLSKQ